MGNCLNKEICFNVRWLGMLYFLLEMWWYDIKSKVDCKFILFIWGLFGWKKVSLKMGWYKYKKYILLMCRRGFMNLVRVCWIYRGIILILSISYVIYVLVCILLNVV